jgi:hypothetical protein
MMKSHRPLFAVAALLLASLACNTLLGGSSLEPIPTPTRLPDFVPEATETPASEEASGNEPTAIPDVAATPDDSGSGGGGGCSSEFPVPDDAQNCIEAGGTLNFQTAMSLNDTLKFYEDRLTGQGLTERQLLHVVSDTTFSIVYDGHSSGKSVVVQAVDLGNGNTNVNIRLETVP